MHRILTLMLLAGAIAGASTPRSPAAALPSIGAPSDCVANAFCALGLRQVYGIDVTKRLVPLAPGESTYDALRSGRVEIAVGFSTDPQLRDPALVQLTDDLRMTGADNVVPLVRSSLARHYGRALADRVNAVSARLSQTELQGLNALARRTSVDTAARRWIAAQGMKAGPPPKQGPPIVLAAQAFPESRLLAQVYAKALTAAGYRARVLTVQGFRDQALDAVDRGAATMMVDYAASLLEFVDHFQGFRSRDTGAVVKLLRGYGREYGVRFYEPATARNVNVLVTTAETAARLGVARLSQLRSLGYPRVPTLRPPSAAAVAAPGDNAAELTIGSKGKDVKRAQARLDELGYKPGAPDGIYGEATRRATAWFQQENGLEPDGALGRATQRALYAAAAKRPRKPLNVPGIPDTIDPSGKGGTVYLTFDDGPSQYTAQVKALLERYGMRGTFFVVGQSVAASPEIVRQVRQGGHAVGNHTYDHTDLSKASSEHFFSEVDSTQAAIRKATGKGTICLRPPYGATNAGTRSLAQQRGYKVVLWDVDPQDWARPGVDAIVANVLRYTKPGSIVLMHDGGGDRTQSVAALARILPDLQRQGLHSAPLDCG